MAVASALISLVDQANAEFVHYAVGQNSLFLILCGEVVPML